jgi:hypothetical protein
MTGDGPATQPWRSHELPASATGAHASPGMCSTVLDGSHGAGSPDALPVQPASSPHGGQLRRPLHSLPHEAAAGLTLEARLSACSEQPASAAATRACSPHAPMLHHASAAPAAWQSCRPSGSFQGETATLCVAACAEDVRMQAATACGRVEGSQVPQVSSVRPAFEGGPLGPVTTGQREPAPHQLPDDVPSAMEWTAKAPTVRLLRGSYWARQ